MSGVEFSRSRPPGPRIHCIISMPPQGWEFQSTFLLRPRTLNGYQEAISAIRRSMAQRLLEDLQDVLYNQLILLECWPTPQRTKGRPPGSGARFRDSEDFHQTVVCDLRHLLDNGLKDTQQELAWLWYERDSDLGVDVDSLVA